MYIQIIPKKTPNKTYHSTVLMENYRDKGKVRHRIISNLTKWPERIIQQFDILLKGGAITKIEDLESKQGKACGGLIVLREICQRLGIDKALGKEKCGRLALLMIMGRILTQGSRLHLATSWAEDEAIEEILNIKKFNEDDLYESLDWLSDNQAEIEDKLFKFRSSGTKITSIYLYDVTSSYLEGDENELAEYGYNRDGKKSKKQIVVGLLCDESGIPITIEVFKGNTGDVSTVLNQLNKLKNRFGVEQVIFVGDRGMIKAGQIKNINEFKWNFITAITKPQIESMIGKGILQMELFEEELGEVTVEGLRYIVRRNPVRVEEIKENRTSKIKFITEKIEKKNQYLKEHPKASVNVALKNITLLIGKLKLKNVVACSYDERIITSVIKEDQLAEVSILDGCYVIKTDVPSEIADKKTIHDRYKDLAHVEQAFRTIKTTFEEIRPIYVRKEKRTRGHVFVCMLAYMAVKHIWDELKGLGKTKQFIFETLDRIQYLSYQFNKEIVKALPSILSSYQDDILKKLKITLPRYL